MHLPHTSWCEAGTVAGKVLPANAVDVFVLGLPALGQFIDAVDQNEAVYRLGTVAACAKVNIVLARV